MIFLRASVFSYASFFSLVMIDYPFFKNKKAPQELIPEGRFVVLWVLMNYRLMIDSTV